jgi:DNA-binding response OmpR family regulator
MNILYIEDEEPMSALYKDLFLKEGYLVDVVSDGQTGLQKALDTHPDIILLDIILPKLNGKLVLTQLRNDAWGQRVPIIVFSNTDPDNSLREGMNQSFPTYFLLKANVTPGDVLAKVKEIIKKK